MLMYRNKMMGLVGKRELRTPAGYEHLIKDANYYHELGIRTEIYWAFVKLKRLPRNGVKQTINELREEEIIPKNRNQDPYIAIRLLKNNQRIEQFKKGEHGEGVLRHAFDIYNLENNDSIDIDNYEDRNKFLRSIIAHLLNNIFILFKNKLAHTGLHSSNITMSGEIVDIGTVKDLNLIPPEHRDFYNTKINNINRANIKDIRDVLLSIRYVLNGFNQLGLKLENREIIYKFICDYIDSISDNNDYNSIVKVFSYVLFIQRDNIPMMKTTEYDDQIREIININKDNI